MTEGNGNSESDRFNALRRYVPLASWAIVFLVLLLIPLRIVKYGYLPPDDALRHAAKAVSGKPWQDILVLGPTYHIDPNWGWHWFLRQFHLWFNWDADTLVVFAIIMLFVVCNWAIVAGLKRPESWPAAFAIVSIVLGTVQRFALGRPFMLSIMALSVILLAWQRHGSSPPKWQNIFWMTPLIALAVFLHGVWYLWALPLAAFFLAQQFRWFFLLTASWILGTFLGSALTGHPIESILQAIQLALHALGMHPTQNTLVTELRPTGGDIYTIFFLGGLIILRRLAGLNLPPLARNPIFWLVVIGWILGCQTDRFWDDWGMPALVILIACDLQALFEQRFAADSFKRLALVCVLAMTCFSATTNDVNSRWTNHLGWRFLEADNPGLKGWLPEKNGIFYSADMSLFFQTFFKNPNADWRYALGFESTLMTEDNFEVYYSVLWNFGDAYAYEPWVQKMQPEDRLVIRGARGAPPDISQLEWYYDGGGIWLGRLPRPVEPGTEPPAVPANEPMTNSVSAEISPAANSTNSVPSASSTK